MKAITSTKNDQIKQLKKLHQRKARETAQQYLLEGFHLIEEAAQAGVVLGDIFVTPRGEQEWREWLSERDYTLVNEPVMKELSTLPTPQGMIAVVPMLTASVPDELMGGWLLLDRIQDPGNLGTMIRTADAAGFTGVVLGTGTVDLYNGKVLRALQGSQYHVTIAQGDLLEWIERFKQALVPVYGTELNPEAKSYREVTLSRDFALIMGNEGQGTAATLLQQTTQNLFIPMKGQAESLNVAVAAGILMFQLAQ